MTTPLLRRTIVPDRGIAHGVSRDSLFDSEMLPLSLCIIQDVYRDGADQYDVALQVDETSDVVSKVWSCQEEL